MTRWDVFMLVAGALGLAACLLLWSLRRLLLRSRAYIAALITELRDRRTR